MLPILTRLFVAGWAGGGASWALSKVSTSIRAAESNHTRKNGAAYARMGAERGQDDPWTEDLVAIATAQRREILPLDEWEGRVRWRDEQLMLLRQVFGHKSRPAKKS